MLMVLLVVVCAAEEVQQPSFYAGNEELRQYLIEAAEKNPGLKARYFEWKAAMEKIPQVTTLEDPMFGYAQFLQSDTYIYTAMVEQKFPWFGTLRTRGDKALAEADAVLAKLHAARNELLAEVKRAYFEYAFLGQSLDIVRSQADTLKEVEEIVKARYALGFGIQADLYRVQIEKDKLEDQHKGLLQSKPALAAKLLEALGREAAEEPEWPQPAEFPPSPPEASVVLARIRTANPDLAAMQHMIEAWDKQVVLARKTGYPDFTLGLEYDGMKNMMTTQYDPATAQNTTESKDAPDMVMVSLKVNLPIWRKRVKAGIREAEQMRDAAEHEKRRATLSYDSAARMALYNIQDALRRYHLYSDVIVPEEKQTYESLKASYITGGGAMESGGTEFLDIQRTVGDLFEFQLEQARAARDVQVACAELEMLMGQPWTSDEAPPAALEQKDSVGVTAVESQNAAEPEHGGSAGASPSP
jgi:outer membrane protein TolC